MNRNESAGDNNILFYTGPDGDVRVEVIFQDDSLWLTQRRLSELFDVDVTTINYHLKEIFSSGELIEDSVVGKIPITATDGKTYSTNIYHLDVIIAVGYRVNSYYATKFRIWATKVLREFITKGFAMDDERLKQGKNWGKDYFEELLERIREIRASERRFYQKITDIFAQCSIDYDPASPISSEFYKTVQNKLHWAITGHTAAELIGERVSAEKPNMGLTTWKNAPKGKVLKSDVVVAKNYLTEAELRELNQIVTMYLDYAELQAGRKNAMTMAEWAKKLDAFLVFNDYEILTNAGSVSALVARTLAEAEYAKFRIIQDQAFESDFDKQVKRLTNRTDTPPPTES